MNTTRVWWQVTGWIVGGAADGMLDAEAAPIHGVTYTEPDAEGEFEPKYYADKTSAEAALELARRINPHATWTLIPR
jgi:hypothetical protein